MTKRYIRTTYTGCEYITAGKLYEALDRPLGDDECFYIFPDFGSEICTLRVGSAHLDSIGEWEIVGKPDEEQLEFDFS